MSSESSHLRARVLAAARLTGTFRLRSGASSTVYFDKYRFESDPSLRRLVVVEDVATTGGQMVKSIEELRAEGATIDTAICVVDREAGAVARLAEIGVRLESLFRLKE
jgi:orotate phosphoribosyltransferase